MTSFQSDCRLGSADRRVRGGDGSGVRPSGSRRDAPGAGGEERGGLGSFRQWRGKLVAGETAAGDGVDGVAQHPGVEGMAIE